MGKRRCKKRQHPSQDILGTPEIKDEDLNIKSSNFNQHFTKLLWDMMEVFVIMRTSLLLLVIGVSSSDTEDESVTSSDRSGNFFSNLKDFKINELQISSAKEIRHTDGGIHISAKKVYVVVQLETAISFNFSKLYLVNKTSSNDN
ncbi:hypothetical protein BDQ17DRAFT_1337288 [Cyathus striatus]|nr:hypothetical protein BDQ17DRAFT_1337288 [Cyathus striatus]